MSQKAEVLKRKVNRASHSQPQQPVKVPMDCPNKNWIELVYKYDSRRAVSGAKYQLFDAGTNQSLASGCLNNMGYAYVGGLPDNASRVKILYTSDPHPFEIFPGYKPGRHNLTPETKEVKEEDGTIVSVAKWLGTALAGDFVDDQSYGQIAFGTVVTLIPVVDQVGDVRDIVANLHKLTFQKKYNEFSPWFGLVVTIIGCVPEVGSVIKGVCKAIFKAIADGASKLPLKKLMRQLNSVGEGNVIRFLREFLDNIHAYGKDAAAAINKIIEGINKKILELRRFAFFKAEEMVDDILARFAEVYKRVPGMVRQVIEWIAENLKKTLEDVTDFVIEGTTRMRNGARQLKERLFKIGKNVDLAEAAEKAGMQPKDVEKLVAHCKGRDRLVVVRFTNPKSLRFHGKPGHLPKPLDVKLKTSKTGDSAGLVVRPKEPMQDWEKDNIKELEKLKYKFDDDGVLRDAQGNKFYGDHDVQSVHQKVEDGRGEKSYLQDQSNPADSSTIDDMNAGSDRAMYQHGAQDNFMVKTDEFGRELKDPKTGKTIPATVEDMNAGRAKIGRQPEKDEKFLVVDEEGNMKILDNPKQLEDFHKANGMIWEYDPTSAIGPAGQANAVMGAERAARQNDSEENK